MVVNKKENFVIKTIERWLKEEHKPIDFIIGYLGKLDEENTDLRARVAKLEKDNELLMKHLRTQEKETIDKDAKIKKLKEITKGIGGDEYEVRV